MPNSTTVLIPKKKRRNRFAATPHHGQLFRKRRIVQCKFTLSAIARLHWLADPTLGGAIRAKSGNAQHVRSFVPIANRLAKLARFAGGDGRP
jgi:hypothetical protein